MKIQYLSDLHLEFPRNKKWLEENPIIPSGEILIVAGDTYYLGRHFATHPYFKKLSEQFEQVFLIPGNHEYYGGFDVAKSEIALKEVIQDNVILLHNQSVNFKGVKFIFTTLWSRVEKNPAIVYSGMMDFKQMNFNGERFSIAHYNQLHQKSLEFLKKELDQSTNGKCVVVTHHLPSNQCNAPEFQGTPLNEGFCTELTPLIEVANVDAWIYGHSHRNIREFEITGTKMLTNQLGYVGYREHLDFKADAFFEI